MTCHFLTIFMGFFVLVDVILQTSFPTLRLHHVTAAVTAPEGRIAQATSAALALTRGAMYEPPHPVGPAGVLLANGSWAAPWAVSALHGAALDPLNSIATFPPPGGTPLAALPALVLGARNTSAMPPPGALSELSDGTILVIRLRLDAGGSEAARTTEVALGAADATAPGGVMWSEGALLHTLAPPLLTAPQALTEALLVLPPRRRGLAWTHVRLRRISCDAWGHVIGDPDCDATSPPKDTVSLAIAAVSLRPATAAARAAAVRRTCVPSVLAAGRGLARIMPDVCPLDTLYAPLLQPADGKLSSLTADPTAPVARKLLPRGVLEGNAQGLRCAEMAARVTLGAKLARGWSTHKSVYRGLYHSATEPPLPVVVKEGGLRWPPPAPGERGVGFSPAQSAEEQHATLQSMFLEMAQEIFLVEALGAHPGIPHQLGACLDADSLLATSVQVMGGVPIQTKGDLLAVAARAADPPRAALRLARSAVALFLFLVEERHMRLEDLHWSLFDVRGNVRQNFSDAQAGGAYAADDLSQFSVDSEDPETGLNLMLIDLDKVFVAHDAELRWYVAEQSMPFVAAQLLAPLLPLLPGLAVAISRMTNADVLLRPPSFTCLRDWLGHADAVNRLSSRDPALHPPLPCDPAVYNQGVRSRWVDPHYGRR